MATIIYEQCRTCLKQVSNMISLTTDHVVHFKVIPLLDLLKTCTSAQIEIDDGFPQSVCIQCIKKVENSYEFRMQCEEADVSLREKSKSKTSSTIKVKPNLELLCVNHSELKNDKLHDENKSEICDENIDNVEDTVYENYEALEDDLEENNDEITIQENDLFETKKELIDGDEEEISLEMLESKVEMKCEEVEILNAFPCNICNIIFPTENTLFKHKSSLHGANFYQCPYCPVRFISEELLDRHVKKHNSNEDKNKISTSKYVKRKKKLVYYVCDICLKKFTSLPTLRLHIRKHTQPVQSQDPIKTFICHKCDVQFINANDLKLHEERMHIEKPNYSIKARCRFCNKYFTSSENLKEHLLIHEKRKNSDYTSESFHKMVYKCKICSHEGQILTEIKDHVLNIHNIDTQNLFQNLLYKCKECNKDFDSIYEYFDHTNQRNKNRSNKCTAIMRNKLSVCTVVGCGKTFPSPNALKNHNRSHEARWPKKCKYCDIIVNKLPAYIQHLNNEHEDLKKFSCSTCDKKFFCERNLKTHSSIHSGERNYMCDYCGFSFHAQSNLVSHRRIHEGIKPYKCSFCPMEFSQYAGLRSHELNHTQEKNYECPTCNRKFLRHSAMKNHLKTHTGQKDYMCHVCGAKFSASSSRKKHLLTHTGERNHVCDFCGKAFGRKSNLTVHRKIHTGETPHVCDICGKGFIQKHVLHSHMGTHRKRPGLKKERNKKRFTFEKINNLKTSKLEELTVMVELSD